jgi:hypothetical protein
MHAAVPEGGERKLCLWTSETGDTEAFVLMDLISVAKDKFVFVVEAKRSSVGEAMKQLLLAMKDARDINNGGAVYGFTTTGDIWQMVVYNGESFEVTETVFCVFSAYARREGTMVEGLFYSC